MQENDYKNIIKMYNQMTKLKSLLRTGWQEWRLDGVRAESVAEHIFGTCMLAVSMQANLGLDIDITKVIMMLVLHETEETIIGDLTFLDEKYQDKRELGRKAVLEVFADAENAGEFLAIIEEFEANETPEARFAKQCDKFEADLQASKYDGHFSLSKIPEYLKKHPQIIQYQSEGKDKVSQYFLENDYHMYSGEFREMADFLREDLKK